MLPSILRFFPSYFIALTSLSTLVRLLPCFSLLILSRSPITIRSVCDCVLLYMCTFLSNFVSLHFQCSSNANRISYGKILRNKKWFSMRNKSISPVLPSISSIIYVHCLGRILSDFDFNNDVRVKCDFSSIHLQCNHNKRH